jgi:hypothetical protein
LGVAKNKLPSWYTALWIILILVLGGSLYAYMGLRQSFGVSTFPSRVVGAMMFLSGVIIIGAGVTTGFVQNKAIKVGGKARHEWDQPAVRNCACRVPEVGHLP